MADAFFLSFFPFSFSRFPSNRIIPLELHSGESFSNICKYYGPCKFSMFFGDVLHSGFLSQCIKAMLHIGVAFSKRFIITVKQVSAVQRFFWEDLYVEKCSSFEKLHYFDMHECKSGVHSYVVVLRKMFAYVRIIRFKFDLQISHSSWIKPDFLKEMGTFRGG
ncbi:hypothetical protein M9H77_14423 [Catharanthus roseus]|uniref:Uncharacterized protein n=1 Tax=Catharanthus roseus TaxID=4058 RepID=A0ACC0BN07_CATRO|nr:hypothetical protein M9H77_14423 [Catharanthus roseus]